MRSFIFTFCLTISLIPAKAQFTQYVISFTDKANSPYSINNPEKFLSERAIQRRKRQNIPIVQNDLPVNPAYIDSLKSVENVIIKNTSKWLNQVCIETSDSSAIDKINTFTFVKSSSPVKRLLPGDFFLRKKYITDFKAIKMPDGSNGLTSYDYGYSEGQVAIHNGNFLHDHGFAGNGMLIAVIDDGFYHYRTLPAFDSVRSKNRILDTYDFVANKTDMNEEDAHGMYCFSLIAANVPGQMVGTAPQASFLLYRSENVASESLAEEQNWVAAAERSDSAGADVITTSLGYNEFDNPLFDHTYHDMDGKTTIIAKGASIAASKGMIILAAAGNEGNKPWHYIVTPGDGIDILTVGAVDVSGNIGYFSSYGPSADGRIKPDVASVGVAAVVQGTNGSFLSGNGTSFATPNLAGLVTCLWQAFPDFTNMEIMDAIRRSSSKFSTPDDRVGYGIPDFDKAYNSLLTKRTERLEALLQNRNVMIYPNPASTAFHVLIKAKTTGLSELRLYDMSGKLCYRSPTSFVSDQISSIQIFRNSLPTGMYILKFNDGDKTFSEKVMLK